jgi:hypothetical protein
MANSSRKPAVIIFNHPSAPNGGHTAEKPSLRDRICYWFDNRFSGGPLVIIGWLANATHLLVPSMIVISQIPGIHTEGENLKQVFWTILSHALTPNSNDPTARWHARRDRRRAPADA